MSAEQAWGEIVGDQQGTEQQSTSGADGTESTGTEGTENSVSTTATVQEEVVPRAQYDELNRQLEMLRQTMMSPEYIAALRGETQTQTQQQPDSQPKVETQTVEEPDWDTATAKDLAEYVKKMVQVELDKTRSEVQSVRHTTELDRVARDVDRCAKKYPDYWNYQKEMVAVAEKYPNMTPEEVYKFAKGSALIDKPPTRSKTVTKQTAPPPATEKRGVTPPAAKGETVKSIMHGAELAWSNIIKS